MSVQTEGAAPPSDAPPAAGRLLKLAGELKDEPGFPEAIASLHQWHGATFGGIWGSSCALVAAALEAEAPELVVVVCSSSEDQDTLADDLPLFTTTRVERFPAWESTSAEHSADDQILGERLRVLKSLAGLAGPAPPRLLVTSIQALLQPVPSRELLAQQTRRLQVGQTLDVQELLRWVAANGFENQPAVQLPGEFSLRGGIVDLFAPDWDQPVRLEFFGDQLESIRQFDLGSQRSLKALDEIEITVLKSGPEQKSLLSQYLPPRTWVMVVEPDQVQEEGRHYLQRVDRPDDFHTLAAVTDDIFRFPSATAAAVASGPLEAACQLRVESVERFSGDITKVRDELDTAGSGNDVYLICQTQAECERLHEVFGATRLAAEGKLHLFTGHLHAGFRLVSKRLVLVSGSELFHRSELNRPSQRRLSRIVDSFLDLREGDYVVHLAHGIGKYRGLKLLENGEQVEEHLELEFHGGAKVFVPAANIDLVQKYIGGSKAKPTLARIGGKAWARQKEAAQQAVTDMAVDMLQLQAARSSRPGIRFPDDSAWQTEFDAAFPYRETIDQLSAIKAIKQDMTEARPMDRLLCGDVGFGKTEVAMRAVFKAVDAGYQVAVLVPTTVLCEQHRRTFTARMAEFPFQIAALSRFCTQQQQKRILAGLKTGAIDIVIGTHRLAQADIEFANLGLIIIDEEQRFGVEVKERLKAVRQMIDVLTMTATPIPRTLHMSLLGVRDISNLETPPEDRLAVETRVTRFDEQLIRHAVMRELNRNGQIFFVHNRVNDIELVAAKLQRIVPEASLAIGHGQMPEGELEKVMIDFVDHKFDILLATTIVESGLDIPNANTIFIDEADRYGLADLHQLRGRVGRYKHRAYCYLLLDPNKYVSGNSVRRLRAIEEFSDMGAGFAIAMRDLEIRGAGNILGTQQSGHIAAVGYEMYCQLLEQAVRRLQHMPDKRKLEVHVDLPGQAFIPPAYVPDMRLKIDLYRRLSRVATHDELNDLRSEIVDRFGPPPPPVNRLVMQAELRVLAAAWQIDAIRRETGFIVMDYCSRKRMDELARRRPGKVRIVDDRSVYVPLDKDVADFERMAAVVKALLQAD